MVYIGIDVGGTGIKIGIVDGEGALLAQGELVSITVLEDGEKSAEMLSQISACGYASSPNVTCQIANREEINNAHHAGLSFGKYRAFLELHALDPSITPEQIQGLTMREIRDWIARLSEDDSGNTQGNETQNSGNGHGQGRGGQGNGQDSENRSKCPNGNRKQRAG